MKLKLLQPDTVLCLDVAFANTGAAVFCLRQERFIHAEVITTSPSKLGKSMYAVDDYHRRSTELFSRLDTIMVRHGCRKIVAEMPTGGSKSSRAASMMAMASAIVFCLSISRKVPLVCMRPSQTKALVRPKGEVSKEEVQALVGAAFPHGAESLWPKNASREHVADAMACWMAYAASRP